LTLDPLFSSTTQFSKIKSVGPGRQAKQYLKNKIKKNVFNTRLFFIGKKARVFYRVVSGLSTKNHFFFAMVFGGLLGPLSKTRFIYTAFGSLSTKKLSFVQWLNIGENPDPANPGAGWSPNNAPRGGKFGRFLPGRNSALDAPGLGQTG
jgi:hypothetical protein